VRLGTKRSSRDSTMSGLQRGRAVRRRTRSDEKRLSLVITEETWDEDIVGFSTARGEQDTG
jgi:hypothetical protein